MAASIDDVVKELQFISSELKVATGVLSRYNRDNEKVKEEENEAVSSTLSEAEKSRYKNIAEQFKSVLGLTHLKDVLHSIDKSLAEQQKNKKESERVSHIARHVSTPTTRTPAQSTTTSSMFGSLSNWFKMLGLGSLLSLIGGIGMIATSMLKLGTLTGILHGITKYASLTGLKTLIVSVGKFVGLLTAPFQILSQLFTGKTLGKLVEGGAMKMGGKFLLEKFPTLFKFLGKSLKFLKPIPVLGSLVSFYFAWDRFKKGDVPGGLLEVASGIASLFPGVGTAISIGLDMINAYRDLSGKTAKEVATESPAKTWLKDKMEKFGEFVGDNCYNWPVIGSLIRAYEHFQKNKWLEGINSLVHAIPFIGWMTDFFVKEEDPRTGQQYTGKSFADIIKSAWEGTVDMMKNVPIIGDLLTAVNEFRKGHFDEGLKSLQKIVPGIRDVIDFLTPSSNSQQQLKSPSINTGKNQKSFTSWVLDKIGLDWLIDDSIDNLFSSNDSKELSTFIKNKVSELYGKVKSFFISVVSSAGDILKNIMSSDNDMSMQFINVLTKLKPSIEKVGRDLQITFTSSLKEQLNALSQIEAVMYMQKDILEENRSLLREIANNTRNTVNTIFSNNTSDTSAIMREEKTFTRRSYINDVRSMNAVVRESLA